jgi:hypothetical protein
MTKSATRTRRTKRRRQPRIETASVVSVEYRQRYGAAGNCGDDLAARLRRYIES